MKSTHVFSVLALAIVLTLGSCRSGKQVTRVDPNSTIDLSGRWNDTDSRLVANALIEQVLTGPWLSNFRQDNDGKKPVVIAGMVKNKSHEHIETETFVKDVEKAFISSQKVRLVQGGEKREEIRGERADQQNYSSQNTMKKWGLEIGADFMMQGTITSIIDQEGKQKVVYYQVDLELTHLETNEVVWIGDKKIKKLIRG
ncbi:MAG: penicillin-binding protein activator LpoB [Salibacteraceae bacterium]